jgi:DNA-binding NtrC family response regulator
MKHLLIVSRQGRDIETIRAAFSSKGRVASAGSVTEALSVLGRKRYDFVFIDIDLLKHAGHENRYQQTWQAFYSCYPTIAIVVMALPENIRQAVHAVKAGADDYITRPVNTDEIKLVMDSLAEQAIVESELSYLRNRSRKTGSNSDFVTNHPAMQVVYDKIVMVAPTRSTVLLTGETGTGKSFLAELIHRHSNREQKRFISVHCGAIPDTLLESELFGHEKGAFTGALRRKLGKFEIAGNGTIFLDEIASITPAAQVKLLQVLQQGVFSRLGGEDLLGNNARIIAATNADLKDMSDAGIFRKDLFYRLNVFPIEIPPLRKRPDDIPLLAETFLRRLNLEFQKQIKFVSRDVIDAMKKYCWPGNIREMENLMERAYILETSDQLSPLSFPSELFADVAAGQQSICPTRFPAFRSKKQGCC